MSVIQIPRTVGTATISCFCCGKEHTDTIVFDKGNGPYALCLTQGKDTPIGDAAITPIDPAYEITDWVPQGRLIGALADSSSIIGSQKRQIQRLEEKLAALTAPAAELATEAAGEAIELPGLTRHHIPELERLAENAYRFLNTDGSNWDPNVCQNAVVSMASQINLLTPNPNFDEAGRSLLINYAARAEPRAILAMIVEIRTLRAALATRAPGVTGAVIAAELPADVQNYLNGLPALLETGKELEKGLEDARANSDAGLKEMAYLRYFNHTDFHYSRLLRTVQCLADVIQPGNGPDKLPLHNPGSSFGSHYLLLKMPEYQQVPAVVGYYDFKRDQWFDHAGAQVDAPVEWWPIAWPGYPKKVIGTPHPHPGFAPTRPGTEAAGEM